MELIDGLASGLEFVQSLVSNPQAPIDRTKNDLADSEREIFIKAARAFGNIALYDYRTKDTDPRSAVDFELEIREFGHSIRYWGIDVTELGFSTEDSDEISKILGEIIG